MAVPLADALRASELLDALDAVRSVLEDHAEALDRLDLGDPPAGSGRAGAGSDLAATLAAACQAAAGRRDFASAGSDLARGAAAGARGIAGRRLAVWWEGAAEVLRTTDRLDGGRLALAMEAGAERLGSSGDPVRPGCLAAVAAAAADGALAASDRGAPLSEVLVDAAEAGLSELEQGPVVDERLAARGAVDAAGAGLLLVLDALAAVVTGEDLPAPPAEAPAAPVSPAHRYVVAGLVEPDPECGPDEAWHLQEVWAELGDVERLDSTGARWPFRLVTPRPGAALEAVWDVGRPRELSVELAGPAPGHGD